MRTRLLTVLVAAFVVLFAGSAVAAGDLYHNTLIKKVISPQSSSNNTAVVGTIIDSSGYGALEYVIATGAQADNDATFTVLLEDCAVANCSDAAAVADGFLQNTEAAVSWTTDAQANKVFMLGYIGSKRYTRLTITPASNTGANFMAAIAILGFPQYAPTQ